MSINVSLDKLTVLQETVATTLEIFRGIDPITCNAKYHAILRYGTHYFAVDSDGKPNKIVALNQNDGLLGVDGAEMADFFNTPLKNIDGSDTCLGIVLARLMDDTINKLVSTPIVVNSNTSTTTSNTPTTTTSDTSTTTTSDTSTTTTSDTSTDTTVPTVTEPITTKDSTNTPAVTPTESTTSTTTDSATSN